MLTARRSMRDHAVCPDKPAAATANNPEIFGCCRRRRRAPRAGRPPPRARAPPPPPPAPPARPTPPPALDRHALGPAGSVESSAGQAARGAFSGCRKNKQFFFQQSCTWRFCQNCQKNSYFPLGAECMQKLKCLCIFWRIQSISEAAPQSPCTWTCLFLHLRIDRSCCCSFRHDQLMRKGCAVLSNMIS